MPLSSVRAVVFDLDGTLYCGNTPVDGAARLLRQLRSQGIGTYYCTNNSTKTRQDICAKMNDLDLPASREEIYSAAYAAARYLAQEKYSRVYCLGTDGLSDELKDFGIATVSVPEEASVVLVGLDPSLDYQDISRLLPLRGRECTLVACNRDKFFPADHGIMKLGCGFVASLVEEVLERRIDYTVGKPNTYMLNMLLEEHGLTMDEIVMIGDSLESDIAMAQAAGCRSVFLSSQKAASGVFQVNSLAELGSLFK